MKNQDEQFYLRLGVGDKVFFETHFYGTKVYTVTRVTEKILELGEGIRIKKDSGRLIGGGKWDTTVLYEYSEENRAEFKLKIARSRLNGHVDWAAVPDNLTLQIYETLKKVPGAFNA